MVVGRCMARIVETSTPTLYCGMSAWTLDGNGRPICTLHGQQVTQGAPGPAATNRTHTAQRTVPGVGGGSSPTAPLLEG